MNTMQPSFTINVDPTNPGQFFACCGLLELADRLWPGAEGWFSQSSTEFSIACKGSLHEVLSAMQQIELSSPVAEELAEVDESESGEDTVRDEQFRPLTIESPFLLMLDWWRETSLKPWAGSMKASKILIAMARAIDSECQNPWNDAKVVHDPDRKVTSGKGNTRIVAGKPREPFYFDSRRGDNVRERDVGFTPDSVKKALRIYTFSYPAVEAFALVGLQRVSALPTGRWAEFTYCTWTFPLPVSVIQAAIVGEIYDRRGKKLLFVNPFRTGRKMHKAFLTAVPFPQLGE